MGQPVSRGCSGAKQPQPAALRSACSRVGWWGFFRVLFLFTRSAMTITKKQGRKVKNNVYATAEATQAVPGIMPVEVFPYQWINNFSVNSFTSL